MNLQENGIKHRLNRYDTFKLNVRAHIECMPAILYIYGKKLLKWLGAEL